MKAIVCTKYGPPEVLQLREVEKPIPRDNELCIKIFATDVSGSDVIVRRFRFDDVWMRLLAGMALGFKKPRNPIFGGMLAGEIDSVGKKVRRFKRGDKVFGVTVKSPTRPRQGTYAEYKCLPEYSYIVFMPKNKTYEEAVAILYGGALAMYFLNRGNIQNGQNVLIYGASGAVGSSAVQLAKYYGAGVTGVCSTANVDLVNFLGADKVFDYTKEDFTGREERYDLIFDAVPHGMIDRKTLKAKCEKVLNRNGKFVSIEDGRPMWNIAGLNLLKELLETGKFKPVIDRVYPLEQMAEAHRYVDSGHKKGTVVITVSHS